MGTPRLITPGPGDEWGPLPPHAEPGRRARVAIVAERLLFIIGVVLLGYYGYVTVEAKLYQAYENRELDAILASAPVVDSAAAPAPSPRVPEAGGLVVRATRAKPLAGSAIGRIEIPRLGVSAVIRAGSDAKTLRLAVGHVPGTAMPGEAGNVGLAGHRDTFFRRLRDIQPDDEIRLVTPEGTYVYRVSRTNVVEPRDTWVLDPTPTPALTLVTCYPFTYIGSAPQRFIVRAVEVIS
jgi:sortase A